MEKFDPYSLIPSEEMREHARKTHLFSLTEMVALIVYSSLTMREKIKLLEQFCTEFNFEEWRLKWLAQPDLTEAQEEWRIDYLAHHHLTEKEIAHIRDADFPPLFDDMDFGQWKRSELEQLAEVDWQEEVRRLIRYYKQSLRQAETLEVGELYCVTLQCLWDFALNDHVACRSLSCIKHFFDGEKAYNLHLEDCTSFVEKWVEKPDGSVQAGRAFLTNYKGEVVYLEDFDFGVPDEFENGEDKPHLYLAHQFHCRTPYHTGDLIEIDARPFHDKFVAVFYVDENEFPDNNTGYESMFYIDRYGRLEFDSIQHYFPFPRFLVWTRMSLYTGEETKKIAPLFKISSIMKQGGERAKQLVDLLQATGGAIYCNGKARLLSDILDSFMTTRDDQR